MPWYAAIFVLVTMSSIGLPGTNGFIGEFLIITGTFGADLLRWSYHCIGGDCEVAQMGPWFGLLAVSGVILGAVYMLDVTQKVFFGPNPTRRTATSPTSTPASGRACPARRRDLRARASSPMYFRDRIDPSVRSFLAVYNSKREALRDPQRHAPRTRGSSTSPCSVLTRGLPGPEGFGPDAAPR
jgi:NADH-quinone oxidoreductase subunit M